MCNSKIKVPSPHFSETHFRKLISCGAISGMAIVCLAPVSSAGTLSGEFVYAGTTLSVSDTSAWDTAEDLNINGGEVDIGRGGSASRTLLNDGLLRAGSMDATTPARVDDSVVNGGEFLLGTNALAKGTVQNGGRITLTSEDPHGMAVAEDSILNGGEMYILKNSSVLRTQNHQGRMYLRGTADATNLSFGGFLEVNGIARKTEMVTGSEAVISAGDNGVNNPRQGGRMDNTILNGGRLRNRYGVDTDTIVNSGGRLDTGSAQDFGRTDNGISERAVINAGGLQVVDNGGTSEGSTVNAGGRLVIQYGLHDDGYLDLGQPASGTANDTQLGGVMDNLGGSDNRTRVLAGGIYSATGSETDGQMAHSVSAIIESGAQAQLNPYAQATDWTIRGDVRLDSDSAAIINSTVDGGSLWMESGTANAVSVSGGQMVNVAGHDSNTVLSGDGRYYLGGVAAATADNLTVGSGTYANINSGTLTDATVSGSMFVAPNPYEPDTTSTLKGDIRINDGGMVTLLHGIHSEEAGFSVSDTGALYLASNAATEGDWRYQLGSLTLNGGSVVFNAVGGGAAQPGWSSLTLSRLDGQGLFAMNTDIAGLRGDTLTVTGSARGEFGVLVADSGRSPVTDDGLTLIRTGGGDARFTLANAGSRVDAGTYEYFLVSDGKGIWSLTPGGTPVPPDDGSDTPLPDDEVPPSDDDALPPPPDNGDEPPAEPEPPAESENPEEPLTPEVPPPPLAPRIITPSAAAALDMASAIPLVFEAELQPVRQRLDTLRTFERDDHLWVTLSGGQRDIALRPDANYRLSTAGLTLGADKRYVTSGGVSTFGGFFSYSDADLAFERGGNGQADSYALGAYGGYRHHNGFWAEGIVKANHFSQTVNARMSSGGRASGHSGLRGAGLHLQGGKLFTTENAYFAPYAGLTGFVAQGADYRLSNGLDVRADRTRSLLAEAGVSAGRTWTLRNGMSLQPWMGAAVTHEFVANNRVDINADGHFNNDLSGTRTEYRAGLRSQLTPRLTAYADTLFSTGAKTAPSWSAGAGLSYRW